MMKKLLALFIFITSVAQAQYTINGTMTPPSQNDWVILYKIEGAKQRFITNTNTKIDTVEVNGRKQRISRFSLTLPANAKVGAYRVTYRQKDSGFVDFLFNKEDVEFGFNPQYPEQSVVFTKSKENKLYNEFLQANAITQETVDSTQAAYLKNPSKGLQRKYTKGLKKLVDTQKIYDNQSKGMLANHFIKASQRYNAPVVIEDIQAYLSSMADNFFNNIDFSSKELYNSSFIIDKITDYVFYLNYSNEPVLQQKLYKESIGNVMAKIKDTRLKKEVSEFLVSQFTKAENAELVDTVFAEYYNKLPHDFQDYKFRQKKLGLLKAAIGRTAPNFTWKEGTKTKSLSALKGGKNYILTFWSTGCSHCLIEIPELYKYSSTLPETKVIAYAIEKDEFGWNEYIKKLPNWHNAVGINKENKWDNTLVTDTYQVHGTPAYFILDENKKIIAKPDNFEAVRKYFTAIKEIKEKAVTEEK